MKSEQKTKILVLWFSLWLSNNKTFGSACLSCMLNLIFRQMQWGRRSKSAPLPNLWGISGQFLACLRFPEEETSESSSAKRSKSCGPSAAKKSARSSCFLSLSPPPRPWRLPRRWNVGVMMGAAAMPTSARNSGYRATRDYWRSANACWQTRGFSTLSGDNIQDGKLLIFCVNGNRIFCFLFNWM